MPGSSQSSTGPKRPRSSRQSRKQPKRTKSSSEKESNLNAEKSSEELTKVGTPFLSREIKPEKQLPESAPNVLIPLLQNLGSTVTLDALFAETASIDGNHENYLIGGYKVYPSVTTILNVYPKDFCTHNAQIKIKAELGRERGRIVHDALAKLNYTPSGVSYLGEINPLYINYIQAGIDWSIENGAQVKYPETKIWSDENQFAGTIDGLAYIMGLWYLIDWKTGWPKYEDYLQLAAYRKVLPEKGV